MLSNFGILSDNRTGRCRIEIPRRVRIQNYRKTEILGKRIIPVKRWGEIREEVKEKLRGENRRGKIQTDKRKHSGSNKEIWGQKKGGKNRGQINK